MKSKERGTLTSICLVYVKRHVLETLSYFYTETLALIFLQSSKHACCLSFFLMNECMDTYKLLATLQDSDSCPMYACCCSEIATS
jgi:hypothetical protein